MHKIAAIGFLLLSIPSWAAEKSWEERAKLREEFERTVTKGESVWSQEKTPSETKHAVDDFISKKKLSSGRIYGESVRNLDLKNQNLQSLQKRMKEFACQYHEECVRDPKSKECMACNGKRIKQIVFDCPDGGLVRVKPEPDVCNKFRPQPHAVKAVRFPFDASYADFNKEAFKLDYRDRPLPKSPPFLNPKIQADSWAEAVHEDFPKPAPREAGDLIPTPDGTGDAR